MSIDDIIVNGVTFRNGSKAYEVLHNIGEFKELYVAGTPICDIASEFNCSVGTMGTNVVLKLKEANVITKVDVARRNARIKHNKISEKIDKCKEYQ